MAKKRANYEGSIYKRSKGTWRALISIEGKRLSFSASTRKECRAWLKDMQNQLESGVMFDAANMSYAEFLLSWLESSKTSLSPSTLRQYQQIARDHILPYLGKIRLVEIRPAHIQSLYDHKVAKGDGLRTVQLTHAVIHRSFSRALKLGLLGQNPASATTPPKPKPQEMRTYSETQAQQLIAAASVLQPRTHTLISASIDHRHEAR